MNYNPLNSFKNHTYIFCMVILLFMMNMQIDAHSKDGFVLKKEAVLAENQNQNFELVFALSIVSAIVLLLLYKQFRLKKKLNAQHNVIQKLLCEKEWLLKEIHHRVKNNLQIVISLLHIQSEYLDNEDALMAIQNSQHRMYAMSLIHQKLYQSDNLANIDMSWYIYELIRYMKEWFDTDAKINFILNTEKVYLDVAQAVPFGLIINEAVNNAIKYAFPLDKKGEVIIELKSNGADNYQLIIADNGVGLPKDFEETERNSLGMNLMMGLTDQIDGIFEMKTQNGLIIKITFARNTEFEEKNENSKII